MGFNVCIIGRNKERIEQAFADIKKEVGREEMKTKTVIAEVGNLNTMADYTKIAEELNDIDIAMLIPNAG